MKTVADYCREAYQNSLEHGFHDMELSLGNEHPELMQAFELAAIARMHSELAEASETLGTGDMSTKIPAFLHLTEEFADLLIRIFDWCEFREYDITAERSSLGEGYAEESPLDQLNFDDDLIAECHYNLGLATETVRKGKNPEGHFAHIVSSVASYFWRNSYESLDDAVQAKMEYNKSRPYLHGKLS